MAAKGRHKKGLSAIQQNIPNAAQPFLRYLHTGLVAEQLEPPIGTEGAPREAEHQYIECREQHRHRAHHCRRQGNQRNAEQHHDH